MIYQDELHEYEYKIGGDLDEVDWRAVLWGGIGNGALVAAFFVLQELDSQWYFYAMMIVGVVSIGFSIWQKANRPDESEEDLFAIPQAGYPPEAIWGFVAGLIYIVLIIVFVTLFF